MSEERRFWLLASGYKALWPEARVRSQKLPHKQKRRAGWPGSFLLLTSRGNGLVLRPPQISYILLVTAYMSPLHHQRQTLQLFLQHGHGAA